SLPLGAIFCVCGAGYVILEQYGSIDVFCADLHDHLRVLVPDDYPLPYPTLDVVAEVYASLI
ncbi:hypothetical protein MKD33_19580, partial [Chromobacterium piscinae]